MDKQQRVSYPKLFGFGTGALGLDLSYGLFFSFLSIYFTDILLLGPIFLMVMTFAARVFDGINDPFIGALIDRTKSRFGKYRFWMLIGMFTNAVVLVLLFTNPWGQAGVGTLRIYFYATVLYFLWDITDTIMDAPYWSMVPNLESDPRRRNIVATVTRAFSGAGQGLIAMATYPMIMLLGRQDGYNAPGFQRWAAVCAAAMIVFLLVTFFTTGKIDAVAKTTPSDKKITLRAVYSTLRNNDQLPVFVLVAILANTGWYLVTGLQAHYFAHVQIGSLGNIPYITVFSAVVGGGMALGLAILPILTRRMRRNSVVKLSMVMAIVGYLGMYLFSVTVDVFPLFIAFGVFGAMGVSCCFVAQTIMLSDLVDYGQFKLGYRSDALVFSMRNLLQKIAYAIQAIVMFAGLAITGYDGALAVQPASAQQGITVMMFLIPPVLVLGALFVFSTKYKLNEEAMAEVNAALASA
ncbi:MAG: glycoside-pentoside-hexuronide (GPH):cation symporter [Oscillospiraceae bacterium]|nr:glycoside-pentoside-hexuronide (GPH):cation symporter [Oscillospiraceae bacterium]